MQELDIKNRETMEDYLEKIRREAYRYCEEVTVIAIDGCCPDPFNQVTYRLIREKR